MYSILPVYVICVYNDTDNVYNISFNKKNQALVYYMPNIDVHIKTQNTMWDMMLV